MASLGQPAVAAVAADCGVADEDQPEELAGAAGAADTAGIADSHTALEAVGAAAAAEVEHTFDILGAVVEAEEGAEVVLGAVDLVPVLAGGMLPSATTEPTLELG